MEKESNFRYLLIFLMSGLIVFSCTTTQYTYKKNKYYIPIIEDYLSPDESTVRLPLLKVINPSIYPVLDSIIALHNQCIYAVLGEPAWFFIGVSAIDENAMYIEANQYNNAHKFTSKSQGAFYYKDHLFVSAIRGKNKESIFSVSNDTLTLNIFYPNTKVFLFKPCEDCYEYVQMCYVGMKYVDGIFSIEGSLSRCTNYHSIFHTVRKGETLSKLSLLYSRSSEDIIKENQLKDTVLTKGMRLIMW